MRNQVHEPNMHAPVVNLHHIAERKRTRTGGERLKRRLRQAQKMEAAGRVASGIAHDLNNVFTVVFAYGEMLFEEAPGDSPFKRYAEGVLAAASRGRELVAQILAYSGTQLCKRKPVDLAGVVAEALEFL
jgi:signal transduction histidine kinase